MKSIMKTIEKKTEGLRGEKGGGEIDLSASSPIDSDWNRLEVFSLSLLSLSLSSLSLFSLSLPLSLLLFLLLLLLILIGIV